MAQKLFLPLFENFEVPTDGWYPTVMQVGAGTGVQHSEIALVSPSGDMWEIETKDGQKAQVFAWDAAVREVEKIGKRIPRRDEWGTPSIKQQMLYEHYRTLSLPMAGWLHIPSGRWIDFDQSAAYWTYSRSWTPTGVFYRERSCSIFDLSVDRHTFALAIKAIY